MLASYKRIMEGMSKLVALIPDFKAESMTDAVAQIIARMTKAEVANGKLNTENIKARAGEASIIEGFRYISEAMQGEGELWNWRGLVDLHQYIDDIISRDAEAWLKENYISKVEHEKAAKFWKEAQEKDNLKREEADVENARLVKELAEKDDMIRMANEEYRQLKEEIAGLKIGGPYP